MEKKLNPEILEKRCTEEGLNQSSIAKHLDVSREAVSKWFQGKSFPRPPQLLKLGRLLGLRHNELVIQQGASPEPLVAFRKRRSCKTTDGHIDRAREMGRLLRPLVPHLEFDAFIGPPSLKTPSTEYRYLQSLAAKLRREIGVAETEPVEFEKLIGLFQDYQAVVVPVMWGKKSQHENALHIHLSDSKTTWIYLNLDVEIHDFKFWMVHELGHVLTIDLLEAGKVKEAEDFADAFAGAFLFPEACAKETYSAYSRARSDSERIDVLIRFAETHTISPVSIYRELQHYSQHHDLKFTEIEPSILHPATTLFNERFPSLSEDFFDGEAPSPNHYVRMAQEAFGTVFFKAFAEYVRERKPSPSTIGSILAINPMDARAIHDALVQ